MTDREAFDVWWLNCFRTAELERGVDDRYIVRDTELAWQGWQAKSARDGKIVRDLIAQSDRDPFMTVGHFVEHCCDAAALASERAKQAEPVAWIDEHVETFVTQYNDVYCYQRKAGVGGGDAERAAMRQVLILALGAAPPAVQEEPVALHIDDAECVMYDALRAAHERGPVSDDKVLLDELAKRRVYLCRAASPADDEAVRLLREARPDVDYALVNSSGKGRSARADLLAAIDAYWAKVKC